MGKVDSIELEGCKFYSEVEGQVLESIEEKFKETKEFIEMDEKQKKLYNIIQNALSEENKAVLFEYAELLWDIFVLRGTFYYRRGFKDGASLIQSLLGTKEINCVFKFGDV